MNKWNIIAPKYFTDILKESKYYTLQMGHALTHEGGKEGRELRKGSFTTWYYDNYKSLLFQQGKIGNGLIFFIDYYLKEDIVGFFLENHQEKHQYAFKIDLEEVKEMSIDNWLGSKLKEIETELEMLKNEKRENQEKINTNNEGNAEKLKNNPGNVTWDDIKDHYRQKKNI